MRFSTSEWTSHKKGEQTRKKILEAIERKNLQGVPEIAQYIGKCERQTTRQIQTLIREGRLTRQNGRLIPVEQNTYMAS